jgi:hypothetical protein
MTQTNGGTAMRAADEARDHPALNWTARLGFACYGLVYLLIGWLTAQLAFGDSDASATRQGALAELAQQPLGGTLLWVAVAGFSALVLWELCQAFVGHREVEGLRRLAGVLGSLCKAVVFGTLAFTAAKVASSGSSGSSGNSQEDGYTARVMSWPFGPFIVGAVGAAIIGYGLFSIVKGLTDRWRKELDADGRTGAIGTALTALARTGYVARGVAFGVVGGLVVWAAVTHDPEKSGGLDDALATLRDAPAGPYLLLLVAIGLACFGVFNIAKAWHMRTR